MKVGIIGADGRMGRIHAQNVVDCGHELTDPDHADVVVIASPDNTHAQYVIRHIKREQAVFCEKPLATNMDDLDRMAQLAETVPLGCHLPLRLRADELKPRLGSLTAYYLYGRREKFLLGWRNSPEYDCVLGGGIHLVDLLMLKLGGVPELHEAIWTTENRNSRTADLFRGRFSLGAYEIRLVVNMMVSPPHRHKITWQGTDNEKWTYWENRAPSDKTTQLRNFLANPQTDTLAIASHRACIGFRAVA